MSAVVPPLATEIVDVLEYAHGRFCTRLEGLTDDELLWEPVAACWTVRERDGAWVLDGGDGPTPEDGPVTTIAWRLCHLACHVLGGFATWARDGGMPYDGDPEVPHTAATALAALDRNWTRWREGLERMDAPRWLDPIGDAFGPHGEASGAALVLHVLDEYVHHAAEVSLLRDLYRSRAPSAAD
jgi:hypothetical protein